MKNNVISLQPNKEDFEDSPRKKKKLKEDYSSFSLEETFADLGIKSFKSEYRKLSKMVGEKDFVADAAVYGLLRAQFAMLVNALPVIEETVHKYKSDRAAYSLVALSNHLREVSHDLKSFGDKSELTDRIRNEVIQPLLSNLATKIAGAILDSRKKLNVQLKDREAKKVFAELKSLQESMADLFLTSENKAVDKLADILNAKT